MKSNFVYLARKYDLRSKFIRDVIIKGIYALKGEKPNLKNKYAKGKLMKTKKLTVN